MISAKLKELLTEIVVTQKMLEDASLRKDNKDLQEINIRLEQLIAKYYQATKRNPSPSIVRQKKVRQLKYQTNLKYIKQLNFLEGSFFGPRFKCVVNFLADGSVEIIQQEQMKGKTLVKTMAKDDFLAKLAECRLENWWYSYRNPYILDGTQWSVSIKYSNGASNFESGGSNLFPETYLQLRKLLINEELK